MMNKDCLQTETFFPTTNKELKSIIFEKDRLSKGISDPLTLLLRHRGECHVLEYISFKIFCHFSLADLYRLLEERPKLDS